jgi:hypothetical protein
MALSFAAWIIERSLAFVSGLHLPGLFAPCYLGTRIGFRREADRTLKALSFAAWIVDRPPALLF